MRSRTFILVFLAGALLAVPLSSGQQDVSTIRDLTKVTPDFWTAGQPRPAHWPLLKQAGVKSVINLRLPEEHRAADEESQVKEAGLRYVHIPMSYTKPTDETVEQFLKATEEQQNRPALIHCTAAIRVGALWMIRRVLRDGWSIEDAEKEAEKIGLKNAPHLNEFARAYIAKHKKQDGAAASRLHTDSEACGEVLRNTRRNRRTRNLDTFHSTKPHKASSSATITAVHTGCVTAIHVKNTANASSPRLRIQLLNGSGEVLAAARVPALVACEPSATLPASSAAANRHSSGTPPSAL